jgi:TolB-like protein/Tfp pilus assembly protein PilF
VTGSRSAVFLSYASEDAEAALKICEALRAAGIEVWFDQSELRGGDAWDRKIRREIRECALFIPIISKNTQARTEGYFRLEWHLADQRTHLMGKGRPFLVPVCLDDMCVDADLPDSFSIVQWSRLPAGATPPAFIERVARLLCPQPPTLPGHAPSVALSIAPAPHPIHEKSVAVLPFANLSADKENEYFSDGLAEEILNSLCQVEGLRVASRNSSFSFKGRNTELGEIANKLHVAIVLEGSVRRAGNRLRITVQLVDARNGSSLWSERYDRELADIFETQDDIARAVTERLKLTLDRNPTRSTNSPEAYELYLKGRHFWHQRSEPMLHAAIEQFERAIQIDPQYALAHAGLADCYAILRAFGWLSGQASRAPAHAAAAKAMALAPSVWEVNFTQALYIVHLESAWRGAEPYFQKAIDINPRSSLAQVYYGLFLSAAGRPEEAARQAHLACELDPLSPITFGHASSTLCAIGYFDAAERAALHALELQPDFVLGLVNCGLARCGLGRDTEAIEPLERAAVLSRAPVCVGWLGFGYAHGGRDEDAGRLLRELDDRGTRGEYIPAFASLTINVGRGDVAAIRETFAKALTESVSPISLCNGGHFLKNFTTDPAIDRMHQQLFGW